MTQAEAIEIRLPQSVVKRVITQDAEVTNVSRGAVDAVSAATKLFVGHLAQQAQQAAKGGKRLTYKDFSTAVRTCDELRFLSAIVPEQHTFKSILRRLESAGVPTKEATPIFEPPRDELEPEGEPEADENQSDMAEGE